jgi:hypothetical protein
VRVTRILNERLFSSSLTVAPARAGLRASPLWCRMSRQARVARCYTALGAAGAAMAPNLSVETCPRPSGRGAFSAGVRQ